MFEITLANGTVCRAQRFLTVLSPHDEEGKKTYFVAQIDGAKRRMTPEQVRGVHWLNPIT